MTAHVSRILATASLIAVTMGIGASFAGDVPASADAAYAEIKQMMGSVPTFVKAFPKEAIPGAWAEVRDLQLSDKTALNAKTKALISLAVSAQIPCTYCIYEDTLDARRAGATDQEIQEAVAISALTRHWSTVLNGMQVDMATFKKEVGGQ